MCDLPSPVNSGNSELDLKIAEWMEYDQNETTRAEIASLVQESQFDELSSRLLRRMEFGTAGLRSALGAGYSRMNDLTVIQATQGLCAYSQQCFADGLTDGGVVIGHDARHGSHRFARLAAAVFLNQGIRVNLFSTVVPTPYVPFAVLKYGCKVGIMVTASHNPKEDNGYKVYWSNGVQIIPPHDAGIAAAIGQNLAPRATSWDAEMHATSPLCTDPLAEVQQDYMTSIQQHCHHRTANSNGSLKITYTAMHGVGQVAETEAFKAFSLKPFLSTEQQAIPDPEFPTVKYPNPEEGKDSLNLAIQTADAGGSTFIIANDPDADRLAIAERQPDGQWKVFTGNETALLLGWWALTNHKRQHPEMYQGEGDSVYMCYSTVSSHILRAMGKVEGFQVAETLTGFKWLGNKAVDLMSKGKQVIFCYEEAIGFMYGMQVLDKDGISAGAVASEMATHLYDEQQTTVTKHMHKLYELYGVHITNNSYFICHHKPTIDAIFARIRTLGEDGKYPTTLGSFQVLSVRDLTGDGHDSTQTDNKPVLPTSSSHMLTFTFSQGIVATLRTSGTEPKIKYYSEIACPKGMTRDQGQAIIDGLITSLVDEWLQPQVNDLKGDWLL